MHVNSSVGRTGLAHVISYSRDDADACESDRRSQSSCASRRQIR